MFQLKYTRVILLTELT